MEYRGNPDVVHLTSKYPLLSSAQDEGTTPNNSTQCDDYETGINSGPMSLNEDKEYMGTNPDTLHLTSANPLLSSTQNEGTTPSISTQCDDYDWVLPVVIVLALLIGVLFALVLLLYKQHRSWTTKKRSLQCCNHHQSIELNQLDSDYHSSKSGRNTEQSPAKTTGSFSTVINIEQYTTSSFDSEENGSKTFQEAHSQPIRNSSTSFSKNRTSDKSVALNDKRSDLSDSFKNNSTSLHSFENNFGDDRNAWDDKAKFYIDKNHASRGINNSAFLDSDSEPVTPDRNLLNPRDKLEKSPSCGVFVDKLEDPRSPWAFDRQLSNVSAPVYSREIDDTTPKLSRPLGKFETVYNLATTSADFVIDSPSVQREITDTNSCREIDSQCLDQRGLDDFERVHKYQIPTIILPEGGFIDFDDHKYDDSISYYNSSSLESCVSDNSRHSSHRRIARANNPFNIEGVSLPRPSSAPCLFIPEPQSHIQSTQNAVISRSSSVGHPLSADIDAGLLQSEMISQCTSSSWSSEFFDLVREAGITDSCTQRRMKKMIDDRYHFLFHKKYPELHSLYPSAIQLGKRDADFASEKRSFSKHRKCKARMSKKRNLSLDSDGYDRLKPPEMIYSEVRPPTKKYAYSRKPGIDSQRREKRTNGGSEMGSFNNRTNRIRTTKNPESNDNVTSPDPVSPTHKNAYSTRENLVQTVYDIPWDLNVNNHGLLRQVKSLGNSGSSPFEPQYETINRLRSCSSEPEQSSRTNRSIIEDKDAVIYDHIHSEQKEREAAFHSKSYLPPMSQQNVKTGKKQPVPPSSSPPKNPNLIKTNNSNQVECKTRRSTLPRDNKTKDEQCLDDYKYKVEFRTKSLTSGSSVTDFPSDTVWRRSSSANPDNIFVNNESFDSEVFGEARFERSTSFIASSCDTPLEHPSSDEEDGDANLDDDVSGRRPSFHKDVMYTHTDDGQGDTDSDGSDGSTKPLQRMTMRVDYDESITISKV